jgi:(1->4)-alpha-D-glucan 1-alpha-D-glucosylmutase
MRGNEIVVVVPRLVLTLANDWRDTALQIPRGNWRNHLTGELHNGCELAVSKILAPFPVALLVKE